MEMVKEKDFILNSSVTGKGSIFLNNEIVMTSNVICRFILYSRNDVNTKLFHKTFSVCFALSVLDKAIKFMNSF